MLDDERAAWLRLTLTPGLGNATARALLAAFGLPGALFAAGVRHDRVAAICGPALAAQLAAPADAGTAQRLERTARWLDGAARRSLVCLADADYPAGLLQLADPPLLLYAVGRRELLGRPGLAIVGSRSATRQGELNAAAFAAHLGRAGLCIVSGMAAGIDGAAHAGALDAAAGTIGVLGTGIDIAYPARNRALADRIADAGLLLSELAIGAGPLPHHFPRRNRLIAALARGVLVVEAAVHSGSLITARLAAEMGREVLAIPGSIHSPQSRGCHRLIRDGARLVESARDVLEELHWTGVAGAAAGPLPPGDAVADAGGDEHPVLHALGFDPVDIDTLSLRLGQDAGAVAAALLELELAQRVERLAGNRYQRLPRRAH